MSGHSKWAQIKRQKGATDQKRGTLFTKLGNAITIAARQGGGDPAINFKLRLAIDNAKKANMPKENIEKAVKRGTGELEGVKLEEVSYEAFGPGGVVLVIQSLTDNKNRTLSFIKHILSKYDGRLSGPGSVGWMFEKKGVIRIMNSDLPTKKEELELKSIDAGAEDFKEGEEEITIYTKPEDLEKVKENLEKENISPSYAEVELKAKNEVKIEDEKIKEKLEKLFEELDNCEEVNDYYTNLIVS